MAVLQGTLRREFSEVNIAAAGKTGTAEYCDVYANAKGLCIPGSWPTHAWTVAYAPYDDPEVAVVAFVYNGGEGASVAGPIVRQFLERYFQLKAADAAAANP
jgi:penicillin-binding protein 2